MGVKVTRETTLLAQELKAGGARPALEARSGPRGLATSEAKAKQSEEAATGEREEDALTVKASGEKEEAPGVSIKDSTLFWAWLHSQMPCKDSPGVAGETAWAPESEEAEALARLTSGLRELLALSVSACP